MHTEITVDSVDVDLLRKQRDFLLILCTSGVISNMKHETRNFADVEIDLLEGTVNLLDAMLDNAEGYDGTAMA